MCGAGCVGFSAWGRVGGGCGLGVWSWVRGVSLVGLVGLLVGWLVGWLADWLAVWLVG